MSHAGIHNFGNYEDYILTLTEAQRTAGIPNRRIVLRRDGYTIKLFMVTDGFIEWSIVNARGRVYRCPTSFRTYGGAFQDALRSTDDIARYEKLPKHKLSWAVLQRM